MAERRGLLTGRSLSRGQVAALEILEVLDSAERARATGEALKLALVGHDPSSLPSLFPSVAQAAREASEAADGQATDPRSAQTLSAPQGELQELSEEDLDDPDGLNMIFVDPPDLDEADALMQQADRLVHRMRVTPDDLAGVWR